MSHHPYEDLYDNYEDEAEEEEEQQASPPRHSKRPPLHSVPLRTMRTAQWKTGDDITALFPELRTHQGQAQAQQPARQSPAQRPAPAAASTRSHIPHAALERVANQDRRMGKSMLRYVDEQGRHVWQQENQRLVFHPQEQPPAPRRRPRLHWLLWTGLGMLVMIVLVIGWNAAAAAAQANALKSTYGYPRTWQTDAVVGHSDSLAHPSHFLFENLHGHILITEYPGGDIAHAHLYSGGAVYSDQLPVTGTFQDVNHDGHPDMLVEIGAGTPNTQTIIFLNNGTQFTPPA